MSLSGVTNNSNIINIGMDITFKKEDLSLDYKLEWDLVLSVVDNIMICLVLTFMLFVALGSSHVDGHQ